MSHSPERQVFLTVGRAAQRLDCSPSTVWRLVRTGALPSVKIGHLRRIPAQAIDAWAGTVAGQHPKGGAQ